MDLEGGIVQCHKPQKKFTWAQWSNDQVWWKYHFMTLKYLENEKHEHLFWEHFYKSNEYPVTVKTRGNV